MKLFSRIFGALLLTLAVALPAQADDSQLWTSLGVEKKLPNDFSLLGELIYRQSEEVGDFVVLSNRLGVGYKATDSLKLVYFFESRNADRPTSSEVRNIFQVGHDTKFEHLKLGLRGRYELRRFGGETEYLQRFRARVKADFTSLEFAGWTPMAYAEQMHISNTVGTRLAGGQERRLQAGLSRSLLGGKFEIAYTDRVVTTPAREGIEKTESPYQVYNMSLKFDLD